MIKSDGLIQFAAPDNRAAGELLETAGYITKDSFCEFRNISPTDSEARLRKLTSRGLLHMGAARDSAGAFIEFRWTL